MTFPRHTARWVTLGPAIGSYAEVRRETMMSSSLIATRDTMAEAVARARELDAQEAAR